MKYPEDPIDTQPVEVVSPEIASGGTAPDVLSVTGALVLGSHTGTGFLPEGEGTAESDSNGRAARHARVSRPVGGLVVSSVLAVSSIVGLGWSVPKLIDYYRPAEPTSVISLASPSQAPTLSPWQEQALMIEQARTSRAELAAQWAAELAKSPIQPVVPSTPTHITIHTPARSVDQLPDEAKAVFPNGVSAVNIDVDLGLFDGTPTGESVPDPNDPTKTIPVLKADPPHDNRGYVWTGTSTVFGVNLSSVDKSRPVYDITADTQPYLAPNAVEIYGHASSVPGKNMPFQNLKDVVRGDTMTITTETGTFTLEVANRLIVPKDTADISDLNNPVEGSIQIVACNDNKDAGHSTNAVVLQLKVVASIPK